MSNLSLTSAALLRTKTVANAIGTLTNTMSTSALASAATSPDDTALRSVADGYTNQLQAILDNLTKLNQNLTVG